MADVLECQSRGKGSTPGRNRVKDLLFVFVVLFSQHLYRLANASITFVCTTDTKIFAYVKDPIVHLSISESLKSSGMEMHRHCESSRTIKMIVATPNRRKVKQVS